MQIAVLTSSSQCKTLYSHVFKTWFQGLKSCFQNIILVRRLISQIIVILTNSLFCINPQDIGIYKAMKIKICSIDRERNRAYLTFTALFANLIIQTQNITGAKPCRTSMNSLVPPRPRNCSQVLVHQIHNQKVLPIWSFNNHPITYKFRKQNCNQKQNHKLFEILPSEPKKKKNQTTTKLFTF